MTDKKIIKQRTIDKNITKSFKMSTIKIPKSKKNNLIIPANPSGFGFHLLNTKTTFIPSIPTDRINETLYKLNKIIDKTRIYKKIEDSKNHNKLNSQLSQALFYFGAITAFLMYLLALYEVEDFKETYIWVFLGVIMVVVLLSVVFMVLAVRKERVVVSVNDIVIRELKKELERETTGYFQQKGYQVRMGTQFCWIEVKKNR